MGSRRQRFLSSWRLWRMGSFLGRDGEVKSRGQDCPRHTFFVLDRGENSLPGLWGIKDDRGPSLRRAIPQGFVQDDNWERAAAVLSSPGRLSAVEAVSVGAGAA